MENLENLENNSVLTDIKYHIDIEINGELETFDIYEFTGHEYLNDDFSYKITIVSKEKHNILDLLNSEAEVSLKINNNARLIKGVIFNVKSIHMNGRYFMYELTLHSWLEYLKHIKHCRIYENSTSIDIIKQSINENANNLHIMFDFNFNLYYKEYPVREYCVQYNESVYDFIFRLMEEDGIYIQIEGNVLNFYDLNISLPEKGSIKGIVNQEVSTFSSEMIYSSYDYRHAHKKFNSNKKELIHDEENDVYKESDEISNNLPTNIFIDRMSQLKGNYDLDIRNKATIALNRSLTSGRTMGGVSKNLLSYAGVICNIVDNINDYNKKSLITSSKYVGTQHNSLQEYENGNTGGTFTSNFTFIDNDIFYKPPLKRHKNRINSKQIAVVGGVDNEEKYIDDMGRVKVKFFWNTDNVANNNLLSCWVRLSQIWNGDRSGSMFIPNVGQEVLVSFVNGDPDYPIVDGMLYNDSNLAKNDWETKKNQWSITSRSSDNSSEDHYSQIMFDSTKGEEEIYLQSEKDHNILIKNNENKTIGNDNNIEIKGNKNTHIKQNHLLSVDQTSEHTSNNSKEIVKQNRLVAVSNVSNTQVLQDKFLLVNKGNTNIIKGESNELFSSSSTKYYEDIKSTFVEGNKQNKILGSSKEEVTGDSEIKVNGTIKLDSQGNLQINSSKGITLNVGGNFVTIDNSGVFVNGSSVGINSGGSILNANKVPAISVEKPKYKLLRVKSISGDKEETEGQLLNFKSVVERFEKESWSEASDLTDIEKSQITYGVCFSNNRERTNKTSTNGVAEEDGLKLVTSPSITKEEKYIHVYAYVNSIETEGYTRAKLHRVLNIEDIEGSNIADAGNSLNYTAKTNLESLDEDEKKLINWRVEYSTYINNNSSDMSDEYPQQGDTLNIEIPKNLSDKTIKITAYENKEDTKAVFYTEITTNEDELNNEEIDWRHKYNKEDEQ